MWKTKIDTTFFWIVAALVFCGFFIFISASLGIHAREGATFSRIVFNQAFFGLLLGGLLMTIVSKIPYFNWQKYSFYIFIASLALTLAVFIPGLGFSHGGAQRWISLGSFTLQPSEFLKLGFILYYATWLTTIKDKITDLKYGLGSLLGLLGVVGFVLLLQPDTDTFMVIAGAGCAMFLVAGGKWKHIGALLGSGVFLIGILALVRPYVRSRIMVFLDPSSDPLGAGYQIQQSLIAIGSGGWFGRGMGQSVQKFNYLPEPIGDSIFAVFAEEWGFIGALIFLSLLACFIFRGLKIASTSKHRFGMYVATGIISLIGVQSLINISSMIGIFPLAGIPLTFVSHGGTSLLFSLIAVGIVLNISKGESGRGRGTGKIRSIARVAKAAR